jgi:hypothetical protein
MIDPGHTYLVGSAAERLVTSTVKGVLLAR